MSLLQGPREGLFLMSEVPLLWRSRGAASGEVWGSEAAHNHRLLITELIKEDSPFCLTRAITRTDHSHGGGVRSRHCCDLYRAF